MGTVLAAVAWQRRMGRCVRATMTPFTHAPDTRCYLGQQWRRAQATP